MQKVKEFVLAIPAIYNFVQHVFDSPEGWDTIVTYVNAVPGDTLLDIGCGTANILEYLPEVEYHGYDSNDKYLVAAKEKYINRNAAFHHDAVSLMNMPEELVGNCDIVLAKGVLHHLSDLEVDSLFKIVNKALKKNGRLITIDPVFLDQQRKISRYLVAADRGSYVRHLDAYEQLYREGFHGDYSRHLENLSRFPLDEVVFVARKK